MASLSPKNFGSPYGHRQIKKAPYSYIYMTGFLKYFYEFKLFYYLWHITKKGKLI